MTSASRTAVSGTANHSYNTLARFASYWNQLNEIMTLTEPGSRVMEVGVGFGLTTWYLRQLGRQVVSVDHKPGLGPSVAADMRSLPFANDSFDVAAAFQILEHLPFEEFTPCLREMGRIAKKNVVISLPDSRANISLSVSLPKLGFFSGIWRIPFYEKQRANLKGIGHHWEIGIKGYPLGRVTAAIEAAGLTIQKSYRLHGNPYHYFFVASTSLEASAY